jgi:hypothetical protein
MAGLLETHRTGAEQFVGDYVRTFARLLDPNLPPATRVVTSSGDDARWPLGQTVAFATISSLCLWGVIASLIYYFA